MVAIPWPDGSVRQFDGPVTGEQIAAAIGPGLAKAALMMKVDGVERDLAARIDRDAAVEIVTRDGAEALELLRHDCAHVLAEAVQELYPGTQITFGPAIEDGRSEEHTSEPPVTNAHLVCRLLLEKKNN